MATGGTSSESRDEGVNQHDADIGIAGFGRIIYVDDDYGYMRSTCSKKYRVYFCTKLFHPATKGIMETLKIGDHLHFEARPSEKKGRTIVYSATKVWSSDANEIIESSPFYDQATEEEAMEYLHCILKTKVYVDISRLYPLLGNASPQVRDFLVNKKKVKKLLERFPSVFQFTALSNTVLLVDEKVHRAIDCVADQLANKAFMGLSTLLEAVSSGPKEIRVLLGNDALLFKKFLQRYPDVFRVFKKNGNVSVSLRSDVRPEDNDSCDTQSVDSFGSMTTTVSGISSSSLSAMASVLSLDKSSQRHESTNNSHSTDLKTAELSAKQQGISKLLNALLNKEPIPLKNLIGYIHASPPEVRNIIGNKMDTLTHFIRNDENFFLLEPSGLVFIRTTVEKRALMYLMHVVRKFETVNLTDVLELDVEKTTREIRALLGKDLSEITASVQSLLAKQDLVPYCNLVLHNNVISVRSCSQQPVNYQRPIASGSISDAVGDEASAEQTASGESVDLYEKCESKAVEFLRSIIERYDLLAIVNVKNYLWQVAAEVRLILQDEHLIREFVGRHPSVFKLIVTCDVIELVDDNILEAIAFISNILTIRGDLLVTSLVGHLSSGSARIRRVTGGRPDKMAEFLKHYVDVFHVFEGEKGLMVGLKRQKSSQDMALSSFGQKTDESFQMLADIDVSQPVSINLQDPDERVERKSASDDPELDFLVDLLKDRGAMRLEDISRCVSEAPEEIQEALGHCEDEILAYMEEIPDVFKVLPGRRRIELVSEDEGNAIEFFLDVLNKLGPTPLSEIHNHLSQATEAICKLTGSSPGSVRAFFLQFPNVFRIFRDNGIEMIESTYEGKGDSGDDDDDLDRPKEQRKASEPEIRPNNETTVKFGDIDFGNIVGLPWMKPGQAASGLPPPQASSCMNDGIPEHKGMFGDIKFFDDTKVKLEDVHISESSSVVDSRSSEPISGAFVDFNLNDLSNNKNTIYSSEGKLDRGFQVDACLEALEELTNSELQSEESHLEILSLKDFMKDAKDEQNVVADLCYEMMLLSRAGKSMDVGELLLICQNADPFGRNWKQVLKLQHLIEILQSDDRFFFDKTNNSKAFLRKDVESSAVAFLRSCINRYGPIDLIGLKYYDYLKTAELEVQAILSSEANPEVFSRKAVKRLWPKYRDQLYMIDDEVLIISYDIETEAIAFLSKLIETHGPIPVRELYKHLLRAPLEVSQYFEEKLINIELFLMSSNLVKHFCLVDETVDLVRNGNLQKNLLLVERLAVSLVVDVIRTQGPMPLMAKNKDLPDAATPGVRQLLGNQWNGSVYRKSLLKKLCSKRSDVFIVGTETVNLVQGICSYQSQDLSKTVSLASSSAVPYADALKSALEPAFKSASASKAVKFLVDIMSKKGPLNLRDSKLQDNALFAAQPWVRALLGGEVSSTKFKPNLVTEFCSGYPSIFKVNKKSVVLSDRSSISGKVASVDTDKGLLNSDQHITGSMFPILPNAYQSQEIPKTVSSASTSVVPSSDALKSALDCLEPALKSTSASIAVEFLVGIISKNGLLSLRRNKLEDIALLAALPSVRALLGGGVSSTKFKPDLVTEFCSGYPNIFTVYKKSVHLNRSNISGRVASVDTDKGLSNSGQHVTGSMFPILPNANQSQELQKTVPSASSSVVPCADALEPAFESTTSASIALEFLVDIMNRKGLLNLRDNKLKDNALLAAPPSVRALLGGEVSSTKFKMDLVIEFCSGYPHIFKVYKKSVDLNRSSAVVEYVVAKLISGSQIQRIEPTTPKKGTLLVDSSSAKAAPAATEKASFSSVVGKSPNNTVQHITGPEFPILPNAVFPAAVSTCGAELHSAAAAASVPILTTHKASINQQHPMHIPFPDLFSIPPHGFHMTRLPLAIPAVVTPVSQLVTPIQPLVAPVPPLVTPVQPLQSVYFPDNQLPKQSYPYFGSLHHVMLPDPRADMFIDPRTDMFIDPWADMFPMTQFQHSCAPMGLTASSIHMPNADGRSDMIVTSNSFPSMQPATVPSPSDWILALPCSPSTFQQPTAGLASFDFQPTPGLSDQSTSAAIASTEDLLVTAGSISSRFETDFHIKQESVLNSEDSKVNDHSLEMAKVKSSEAFEIGHSNDDDSYEPGDSNCFEKINYNLDVNRTRWKSLPNLCSFEHPDLDTISNAASKTIDSVGEQTEMRSSIEEAKCKCLVDPPSAMTSDQRSSLLLSWQSAAALLQMPTFKEEFGQRLEGLGGCFDFLEREASKSGLAEMRDERCLSIAKKNRLSEDKEVTGRTMNGVVLSAQGNQLYIKREDGHLISCSSENCCRHLKSCSNIGRHFAIGETVNIISDKSSKSFSVCHSSSEAHGSGDQCRNKASSNFKASRIRTCCDSAYIRYGRGRVCLLSEDMIGVMMGSLEMAALIVGEVNHGLLLNDVVSFSAKKVRRFLTPWMLEYVEKTALQTDDDSYRQNFSFHLKTTKDFGCQVHLTPAESTSSSVADDVINVYDQ